MTLNRAPDRIEIIYALHLACIASVSVGLETKERPRNGTGTVFCQRGIGARANIRKRGGGRGRKETLANRARE